MGSCSRIREDLETEPSTWELEPEPGTWGAVTGSENIWSRNPAHEELHSWAQQKLSQLSPLNIFLSINGPLLSLGFNRFNDERMQFTKI